MGSAGKRERAGVTFGIGLRRVEQRQIDKLASLVSEAGWLLEVEAKRGLGQFLLFFQSDSMSGHLNLLTLDEDFGCRAGARNPLIIPWGPPVSLTRFPRRFPRRVDPLPHLC